MKRILKKLSAYLQTSHDSYRKHNKEFELSGKLEDERKAIERYQKQDVFNDPSFRLGKFLAAHPQVRALAFDIGSGNGWLSAELAKYFKRVVGIEPSAAGQDIARRLHPVDLFPNIEWKHGFAEEILPQTEFKEPALFVTSVVLSHMRDKEVAKICQVVNELPPAGSILCFNECWGDEWHQLRWHVRTTNWWQENLSNWELDFHGPQIEIPERHQGFHAVKIK